MSRTLSADEIDALVWCEAMANMCAVERIVRDGAPYLNRFYVGGWSPTNRKRGPAVFLHQFVASDAHQEVHSHPWGWSASLIVVGGYREERCAADGNITVETYLPGDVNILAADDKHRIDLIGDECWTLFLAGNLEQAWAFAPRC